ncbi:MAG TPA: MFS transporter [Bacteroidaceae bacterium]|nr:MFS transporter [Bacteroidaceae bacterium]
MSRLKSKPWGWVPTLYFSEGFPYVLIVTVSVLMFKKLDVDNSTITLYTGWLYLPWVIKPIWSPFVDLLKTKRWWILITQFLLGSGLAGIAFSIPTTNFFQWTMAIFWLLAFSSATHDIAADGFYMLGLTEGEQSFFVGIRNTFYRIASIAGQGGLLIIAGLLEKRFGDTTKAWSITFITAAGLMILLALYHSVILPKPLDDKLQQKENKKILVAFWNTFIMYFKKPHIVTSLLFILFYRLPEAQLLKISPLFLLDSVGQGGLNLSTDQVGVAQGTVGVLGVLIGGILGGAAISRKGLSYWLWPMVLAISVPDIVYVYLSFFPTTNLWLISICIFIEQLGYGFGFTAYAIFLIYFAKGDHKTSHYAISTGIMALGMMLPGMISGWIQELLGYKMFFIWIMICCSVTFIVAALIKIDPSFGKIRKK